MDAVLLCWRCGWHVSGHLLRNHKLLRRFCMSAARVKSSYQKFLNLVSFCRADSVI